MPKRANPKLNQRPYVRAASAATLAAIATIALAFGTYYMLRGSPSSDSWADLGAAIYTVFLAGPYLLIITIAAMRLFRIPDWFGVGAVVAVSVAALVWFDIRYYDDLFLGAHKLLVIVLVPALVAMLTLRVYQWARTQQIGKKVVPTFLLCLALTLITTLAAGKLLGMAIAAIEAPKERAVVAQARADDLKTLQGKLAKLNFTAYTLSSLPKGYSVNAIVPSTAGDFGDDLTLPNLTFRIDPQGDALSLTVYEVAAPASFKPASGDCGPFDATTFPYVGDYTKSCQPQLTVNGVPVYLYTDTSTYPEEYGYYVQLGATLVMLQATDGTVSNDDLNTFVQGLQPVKVTDLPKNLLQLY
ncbi:MAG TPA: hypothetical protein VLE99_02295 [Candidatus Saccharimonadales bacterium]|nr:hypothetical protein [Candidatus Saccharimonadales bacterium]